VISNNCPKKTAQQISHYARIGNTPLVIFSGSSLQLGELCGKPFLVSCVCVLDMGSINASDIKG
jgi:large subunit ribosomal protein L30e